MPHPIRFLAPCAFLVAGALLPPLLHAQVAAGGETRTVVAGEQYEGSDAKETLLGADHRYLWTTPIRVPVLDLRRFAGGLTPTQRGGGMQTRSVRFRGADGREYAFRSVNKWPHLTREPALRDTPVGAIIQDQVSSLHPGGPLVVPPLLEAVGVLHVKPQMFVMPDDPALGEFREEFAGMLGTIEERPNEADGSQPGFGPFERIIGTDRLLERLEDSPEDRIDAAAYLTARLMDLLMGDWDRHADQWRWAQVDRGGARYWIPIPRDRDYAFVNYDGLIMRGGRVFAPNAVRFDPELGNLTGLTLNGRELDRRLLGGLDETTWDSVVAFVHARVTDEVIHDAVQRMPAEYVPQSAPEMAEHLRRRREGIPRIARDFFALVSGEADLYGTDEADYALVEREGEGVVRVRLFELDEGRPAGEPYLDRRVTSDRTREVRIYLQGGADRAVIRGDVGSSVKVRVIGGGGDDLLADSSHVRGGRGTTAFYDHRGDNQFVRGSRTGVDTRDYEPPERTQDLSGETYRDWGDRWGYAPLISYQSADGPVLGFGRTYTRFGFRSEPYRHFLSGRAMVGLGSGAVAVDLRGDFRRSNSEDGVFVRLLATQLDPMHFYGYGNDTRSLEANRFYVTRQNRLIATSSLYYALPASGRLAVGPVAKLTRSQHNDGTPFAAAPNGEADFAQIGAHSELQFDWRDVIAFPRRGALLQAGGSAYPGILTADGAFGEAHATASTYLTPPAGWAPTLALRGGGQRVWGDFPVHESAFLGGSATIRGYPYQRYAGDALVFGNAEARLPLGTVKVIVRGDLGLLALADAGRVYFQGDSPGGWHTSAGGGLSFRFRIRDSWVAASAIYAQGEEDGRAYFKLGAPF